MASSNNKSASLVKVVVLFFSLSLTAVHAEIYKWVDEHGNLQFGDKPNEETPTEKVQLQQSNHYQKANHPNHEDLQSLLDKADAADQRLAEKKAQDQQAKQSKKNAQQRQRYQCFVAHKQLVILDAVMPITVDEKKNYFPQWLKGANGDNYTYVDDKDRPTILIEQKEISEKHCTTEDMHEEAKMTASMYWNLQKKCNTPFAEDEKMEKNVYTQASKLVETNQVKRTNNLKQEHKNSLAIEKMFQDVSVYCQNKS